MTAYWEPRRILDFVGLDVVRSTASPRVGAVRSFWGLWPVALRPFHTTQHGLPHATNSGGRGRDPLQLHQSADVVAEVHHADLELGPRQTDGAHDLTAHRVLLMGEHVLDTGTDL